MSSEILLASQQNSHIPVTQLFSRKELVGKGAYGGVYKGVHNPTGLVVALKVIDLDTPDDDISEIQKEVALLSEMRDANRHNITLYHGCYMSGHELWIAMDFASGGSIRTLMKSGSIEEKYIVVIVREVLVALSFLHRQGIIHRDVKAANVLLTQAGKILLCDFGVAAHLQTNNKRSTFIGTPLWMAPEVITDGKLYDTKADIWSLGVTLFEIATGNPPYFGMEPLRACALIPRTAPAKLEAGSWSTPMREFLSLCLQVDPTSRLTADELAKTKWIKSASKVPMVLLRELIVRYVSWIQTGGQRASLAGMDSLAREDTFDIEDDIWDFDIDTEEPKIEPLGDEPPRTLDAMAAISQIRPPKAPIVPRTHPLLRLFETESNPYANGMISTFNLPSGMSSIDTVRPTISIPTFEEMDEMVAEKSINLSDIQDRMSPITAKPSPFSWASHARNDFSSPLRPSSPLRQRAQTPDDMWAFDEAAQGTPIAATFPDSIHQPVSSSPSLPSLSSNPNRPFALTRRRADTAPSFENVLTGVNPMSIIPHPPPFPGYLSHSTSTSISSANSGLSSENSSFSSHTTTNSNEHTMHPSGFSGGRKGPMDAILNTDANRPFRTRTGSDAHRPFQFKNSDVGPSRPKTPIDARSASTGFGGAISRNGIRPNLQISTGASGSGNSSGQPSPAGSRFGSGSGFGYPSPGGITLPSHTAPLFSEALSKRKGSKTFSFNNTPMASSTTESASAFPFPEVEPSGPAMEFDGGSEADSIIENSIWPGGPAMEPLNYADLGSAANVHKELEKTIGQLASWLGVIDSGLEKILQGSA